MAVNRSITTVIESNSPSRFFDTGNGPTKSTPMDSHGREGTLNGFNNPNGF